MEQNNINIDMYKLSNAINKQNQYLRVNEEFEVEIDFKKIDCYAKDIILQEEIKEFNLIKMFFDLYKKYIDEI